MLRDARFVSVVGRSFIVVAPNGLDQHSEGLCPLHLPGQLPPLILGNRNTYFTHPSLKLSSDWLGSHYSLASLLFMTGTAICACACPVSVPGSRVIQRCGHLERNQCRGHVCVRRGVSVLSCFAYCRSVVVHGWRYLGHVLDP